MIKAWVISLKLSISVGDRWKCTSSIPDVWVRGRKGTSIESKAMKVFMQGCVGTWEKSLRSIKEGVGRHTSGHTARKVQSKPAPVDYGIDRHTFVYSENARASYPGRIMETKRMLSVVNRNSAIVWVYVRRLRRKTEPVPVGAKEHFDRNPLGIRHWKLPRSTICEMQAVEYANCGSLKDASAGRFKYYSCRCIK